MHKHHVFRVSSASRLLMNARAGVIILAATTTLLSVVGSATAQTELGQWLTGNSKLTIQTEQELGKNVDINMWPHSCTPQSFKVGPAGAQTTMSDCVFTTRVGTMSTNGYLVNGPYGTTNFGYNQPLYSGSSGVLLVSINGYIGYYKPSSKVTLEHYKDPFTTYNYYYISENRDDVLRDKNGASLQFRSDYIAFSADGRWMAAVRADNGIMLYDMTTFSGKLIGWEKGGLTYSPSRGSSIAISDNGDFIALNATENQTTYLSKPTLKVYDTRSCVDQTGLTTASKTQCPYNDLWNGTFSDGRTYSGSLFEQATAKRIGRPYFLRFVGDRALLFDSWHDLNVNTDDEWVATYRVSYVQDTKSGLGLLGMGDSYISGEGAFYYRAGTDTAVNKCHTSWLSYPYKQGVQYFSSAKSVACSGAKMADVTDAIGGSEDNYLGQVANKLEWHRRSDRQKIKDNYMPGYANQVIFARERKPKAIVLSIGGNDVHFADIVTQCVNPLSDNATCYKNYEGRLELMQQILGQYDRLVKTYKDVMEQSGGARLYVVGYPQIAKQGGNCGANVHLDSQEVTFSNQLITYLDGVIARAAAEAGAFYVDTQSALDGYRLCEAPAGLAAVNGLTAGDDTAVSVPVGTPQTGYKTKSFGIGKESYHPTAWGHKLLGYAIASKTANFTAVMPSPVAGNKPALNLSDALLQGAPHGTQIKREVIWGNDFNSSTNPLLKGNSYQVSIPSGAVTPGSQLQVVLHSQPVVLYDGVYAAGSQPVVTIPAGTEPGLHTLHIYGRDASGQDVDIRQVIYVAASDTDYDGDGIANQDEACLMVSASGQDQDHDGIDDACDGNIIDPAMLKNADITDVYEATDFTEEPSADDQPVIDPASILQPVVAAAEPAPNPSPQPPADNTNTPAPKDNSADPATPPQTGGNTSDNVAAVVFPAGEPVDGVALAKPIPAQTILAPYYGYALAATEVLAADIANPSAQQSTVAIAGTTDSRQVKTADVSLPSRLQTAGGERHGMVYVWLGLLCVLALILVARVVVALKRRRQTGD